MTCNLVFGDTQTLANRILMDNTLITAQPTLTTSSNNTSDESGLYASTATNTGETTYYFRGEVENNYVSFAGFTWRIIRINEDGTVRLIMQDGINNNATYAFNLNYDNKSYMYYSNSSNAKTQLESWYTTNITNNGYSSYVASGNYYCEQAKVSWNSNYTTNSGASMTVYTSYTPNFKCSTDGNGKGLVNASIGLITYDEAIFAGIYLNKTNSNIYLSGNYSFTMSPAGYGNDAIVWSFTSTGVGGLVTVSNSRGLRPVININANTIVTGYGTSTEPYTVQ
jgi:hypothetical protein